MATLYGVPKDPEPHLYKDYFESLEEQLQVCASASTLYVGNIAWSATKDQLYYYFSSVGNVTNIYLGLDKNNYEPCGFAFVVYETPEEAYYAVKLLNNSFFNGTSIKVERDWGFDPQRQYARGRNGYQVLDEATNFMNVRNHSRQKRRYDDYRDRREDRGRYNSKRRNDYYQSDTYYGKRRYH